MEVKCVDVLVVYERLHVNTSAEIWLCIMQLIEAFLGIEGISRFKYSQNLNNFPALKKFKLA